MPKKSRRSKVKRSARVAGRKQSWPEQIVKPAITEPQPTTEMIAAPAQPSPETQTSPGHYDYVKIDLKHIGILSGAMITVLIVLSFILG